VPMDAFPHTYYVVPEARHVRVCSLLVYADGPPAVNSLKSSLLSAPSPGAGGEAGRQRGHGRQAVAQRARGGGGMRVSGWGWVVLFLGVTGFALICKLFQLRMMGRLKKPEF